MNRTKMASLMDKILKQVSIMRDSGQKEYAHDEGNVFANFNRVGHLLEEDRKKVLMTYMLKHVDGIAAYVKGHKSQREDVRGRITDCIVYLMLLWGMIEEEDGLTVNEQINKDVRDVLKTINTKSTTVPVGRGLSKSNGLQHDGDLQKVREKGSRIQESQEMGTT